MKRFIPIIGFIVLLAFSAPALAQTSLPEPGLLPDSPFYFIKRIFEGIGTLFTFNVKAKAERYLDLAAKRIAEAKKLAEREKNEIIPKAVALYGKARANVERLLEKIKDEEERAEIAEKVQSVAATHLEVLGDVLEKAPEAAQEGIKTAIDMSKLGVEKAAEILELRKVDAMEQKDEGEAMDAKEEPGKPSLKPSEANVIPLEDVNAVEKTIPLESEELLIIEGGDGLREELESILEKSQDLIGDMPEDQVMSY